jgi:hypothetical protein
LTLRPLDFVDGRTLPGHPPRSSSPPSVFGSRAPSGGDRGSGRRGHRSRPWRRPESRIPIARSRAP